jgi:hypothetical protein
MKIAQGAYAVMQADGKVVVYSADGQQALRVQRQNHKH